MIIHMILNNILLLNKLIVDYILMIIIIIKIYTKILLNIMIIYFGNYKMLLILDKNYNWIIIWWYLKITKLKMVQFQKNI